MIALLLSLLAMAVLPAAPLLAQFPPEEFLGEDDFDTPPPPGIPPPPPGDDAFNPPPPPPPPMDDSPPPPPPGGGTSTAGNRGTPGGGAAGKRRPTPPPRPIKDAGIEDITNENYPELIDSFDYPNAEITDIVKAISELTGKNFIIDPGVRGKITIIAPSKITVAEAYKAFLSALAINGFTVVPSGKFLKIRNVRDAQRENIETYSGAYSPDSDQMITRIVHLKYISADEVVKSLRMLPSKNGEMYPYAPTNSLIISDFGSNIERVMAILREL
ncbi:MAG TPA: secretin N-terminal domain-containing protein, partial [Bdellovibrionales bacterium]|nr:secretin N-terminal domain-containing protein [Bdellovibrionales bacterium]